MIKTIKQTIHKNDKGIALITALILIAVLAIAGTVVVITTTTDITISSNYKSSTQAFYIAEAGFEHAKAVLKVTAFDDVLDGTHGGSPGILNFGENVSFGNGTYTVTVSDDSNDWDGDTTADSNGKVVITSTGTLSNGSKHITEATVSKIHFDSYPAAITMIDNENGATDNDRIVLGSGTDIDPVADNGSQIGNVVKDVFITGDDTLDGSANTGDGSGDDKLGVASQEEFRVQGGVQDPAVLVQVGFYNERLYNSSDPNFDRPVLDGGSYSAYGTGTLAAGPSEVKVKSQVSNLQSKADYSITANKLSQTSYTNFGTASSPKITYIPDDFDIDNSITGYGIMVVEGSLKIKGNTSFEFHGIIYIVCRGQLEIEASGGIVNMWGQIIMITYGEPPCTGISGEERLEIPKGTMHIYYSTDAINKYADPLTFEVDSWREVY
ncbi:putative polygalacturonase [Candidatus Kuenenia stuttgartiensis]|uniref:Putative polygalacturonase n=2 Tax=Candidatus Kuenenia TaxID=380738 RepID=Q1PWL9_KUEST|nr:PilX N-terminal domain-containing pilus assembly protein [Candidatus Kuenenia stuttgartiensis]QII13901.1 putative polygalacturonase [Candidatus Kuenenia stuttgartiensis]CAJ71614.1 similar to polygalacturonase [Candidatus Kuenenia stuttgartiensis]